MAIRTITSISSMITGMRTKRSLMVGGVVALVQQ
jgi:hypothetical protein